MKIKRNKKQDVQKQNIPNTVCDVERESIELLKTVNDTRSQMSDIYTRMINNPDSDDMASNAESLKRATFNVTTISMT